jgi:hypothetical protein
MRNNMPSSMRSQVVYLFAMLVAVLVPEASAKSIYSNPSCPVTFVVPIELELHDVVGGDDLSEKILCQISIVRKNKPTVLPLQKSFDDVRYLSDVVLKVKNISLNSRLSEFNFISDDHHVSYTGKVLSSEAIAMGYKISQIRPIEYYSVGRGDLYVGIQDFIRKNRKQRKIDHSVSYVFLLGNEKYSIDVELTYRDKGGYSQIKNDSILNLLRSANFNSDRESTEYAPPDR